MIIITQLTQPARGAVIAFHCEECRRTTFLMDELALKPEDGDFWLWKMCPDNPQHGVQWKFNTRMRPPLEPEFIAENILRSEWRSS